MQGAYTAIVPIKAWARSKTRLHPDRAVREALARAFAEDVLRATALCASVGAIVVVSSEPGVGPLADEVGATVLPEPVDGLPDPLNAAVLHGAAWAGEQGDDGPIVVVPADLPALTPESLADALELALPWRGAFCADTAGSGTTLLMASSARQLRPAYGDDSARRHTALGAAALDGVDPRVRRDVDRLDDLRAAAVLGVGPATLALSSPRLGG